MNIRYGNPRLDAEISHSFELGYTYFTPKLNFSLTTYGSLVNNSIESITRVETSGSRVTTYENIGKDQRLGVSMYMNYRPSAKLNIYFNSGGSFTRLEANSGYSIVNDGFNYRLSLGGRWTAWKNGTVNMNVGVYSPNIQLQGKSSGYYYTGFGVSQYFLKRKLMISAYANDPFWHEKSYDYENHDATFTSRSEYSYLARNFRISLTYNFGKMDFQVKKAQRGIQNDDLKSGGSQQGSSGGGE
jgi:outer membrane receptor for ferrienterochelin and colicin